MFSPYPGSQLFDELVASGQIQHLDNDYFRSLLQQIDFFKCRSYNQNIAGVELSVYRLIGMGVAYMLGYIRYPRRIFRSINNICFSKRSDTVFEQRVIELLRFRKHHQDAM
jgi:hypothetical protein